MLGPSLMRAANHPLVSRNFVEQVTKTADGLAYKIIVTASGQQGSPIPRPECHL